MSRSAGDLIVKDPQSVEPFGFDWTAWLAEVDDAETIATSTYVVTGPDGVLTTSSPSIVTGSLKTQVKILGGTAGRRYTLTNHIVTSSGCADDRSCYVLVQNR